MGMAAIFIWFLALSVVFAIRVGIIHVSANFLLAEDPGVLKAAHLAVIAIFLDVLSIFPLGGLLAYILFIAYAAKIYETDRLAGMAIAFLSGFLGILVFTGIRTGLTALV